MHDDWGPIHGILVTGSEHKYSPLILL